MGRPIKQIFIGNRDQGGGGQGVASVTVTGGGTGYSDGQAVVFSAPELDGGVLAEGFVVEGGDGIIDSITITVEGGGYLAIPTVTAPSGGGNAVLAAVLTSRSDADIICWADTGGGAEKGDIDSQKGTHRYRVTTPTGGTLDCTLVQNANPAPGEMYILATDSSGGTYYVKKLTNNTVTLQHFAGTQQFPDDTKVKWATTPVLNESVKLNF